MADQHGRTPPSFVAGDRASLVAFLDYQRATLAWKCDGLSAEQLKRRAVPTSSLSLLGLVRHAAEVERSWFQSVVAGETIRALWDRVDGDFADFHVDDADVDEAFARCAGIARLPGRPPKLSHSELLCLAVMQAMLGFHCEARGYGTLVRTTGTCSRSSREIPATTSGYGLRFRRSSG